MIASAAASNATVSLSLAALVPFDLCGVCGCDVKDAWCDH
jgi:hypothetical protein